MIFNKPYIFKQFIHKGWPLILMLSVAFTMLLNNLRSQPSRGGDYFVQHNDSTFCVHLIYFSSDTCQKIKWYDKQGIGTTIDCIIESGVTAFGINGRNYELVNFKKDKSRFFWKKIEGMITLYVQDFTETLWYDQNMPETETQKFVNLHNNIYQFRNKRNIQRTLLPVFTACEGFRSGYYGRFSMDELDNMIKVYNANCVFTQQQKRGDPDDYIVDLQGDTIFCLSVELKRSSGFVNEIRYTVPVGRVYTISGRNNCLQYKTLTINKQVFDLIPVEPGEPGKGKIHVWRKIDGEMKLYDYFRELRGMEKGLSGQRTGDGDEVIYTVLQDDDIYVKVTDKNLNKIIMPYLLNCDEFATLFKDEVTTEREVFEFVVKLYNSLCKTAKYQ